MTSASHIRAPSANGSMAPFAFMKPDKSTPPRSWRAHEIALVVIATILTIAAAKLASDFLVPVVAGTLLAYALAPLVDRLTALRLPRVVAATAVLVTIVATFAGTAWLLRDDAAETVAELPEAARKVRNAVREHNGAKPSALANVKAAAEELEHAAAEATGGNSAPKSAPTPVASDLSKPIATHGTALVAIVGQLGVAAMLALFLLAAGDAFRRKLVRIAGSSLARRRITVGILDEIDVRVQRYLLVTLLTNVTIALVSWGTYSALGLSRAALWGVVGAVLHFIPYVGTLIATIVVAAAALVETGSLGTAAWATAATLAIALVFGLGLNTWLQGRACRMNAVAVFVAVLFFGWLWGGWGLLLGAPLAAVMKTVFDRIELLRPFGELLGDGTTHDAAAAPVAEASAAQ